MYKLICLIGKSGSGKDTIKNFLKKTTDFNFVVRSTTRPKRDYEKNGVDYFFLNENEFLSQDFIEINQFREWYYGTSLSTLSQDKINFGVFDPKAVAEILKNKDIIMKIFYLDVSDQIRLARSYERENLTIDKYNEIQRRLKADEEDFKNLPKDCIILKNEKEEDINKIVKTIKIFGQNWAKQDP